MAVSSGAMSSMFDPVGTETLFDSDGADIQAKGATTLATTMPQGEFAPRTGNE